MATDLRLAEPLNTAQPVNVVFGGDQAQAGIVNLRFRALANTLQPVNLGFGDPSTSHPLAVSNSQITLGAKLPALRMTASVNYDNAVSRGVKSQAGNRWQDTDRLNRSVQEQYQVSGKLKIINAQPWQSATRARLDAPLAYQYAFALPTKSGAVWKVASRVNTSSSGSYSLMLLIKQERNERHAIADKVRNQQKTEWQDRLRQERPRVTGGWSVGIKTSTTRSDASSAGDRMRYSRISPWQKAMRPLPGLFALPKPPIVKPPCYTPPDGVAVLLRFLDVTTANSDIRFACGTGTSGSTGTTTIIPIKQVYIVINNVSLTRIEGNQLLPDVSLSLNIDMDSWTWGFSASLPASSLSLVEPGMSGDPVLLQASINGVNYRLLAESITRDRQFGKSTITVTGRGQSAALADPYSPVMSFGNDIDRTAQQLMQDALSFNGVPIGWALDWRIEDWLVPAGNFSHRGSYMSAVTQIASAAGAFIQPDPVAKTLRVRSRMPIAPWAWNTATPDVQLPSSAIVKESIAWADKPDYNAVYLSGTSNNGVLAMVKRQGTAGDNVAPMITDALLTDAIAARQRGRSVLADVGRNAVYSLSLPILPQTGIIEPGTLVRYVDTQAVIGITKGVSVTANGAQARQTIEVQTYA
jgi:hypothetical protein